MSPYNQFRLNRLLRELSSAKLVLCMWESANYTGMTPWHLAHAKAVVQYREYKLDSFLKHHGVEL